MHAVYSGNFETVFSKWAKQIQKREIRVRFMYYTVLHHVVEKYIIISYGAFNVAFENSKSIHDSIPRDKVWWKLNQPSTDQRLLFLVKMSHESISKQVRNGAKFKEDFFFQKVFFLRMDYPVEIDHVIKLPVRKPYSKFLDTFEKYPYVWKRIWFLWKWLGY